MSLQTEATAAKDGLFISMCQAAAVETAQNVYTEATTLNANLQSSVAVTSIPVTPNLSASIATGTVISVGGEDAVATATSSGASAIGCAAFTPARNHTIGELVSPPAPSNHATRAVLATNVVRTPDTYGPLFAWQCAAQGDTNGTADGTIRGHVSAVWNTIAGA